MTVTADIDVAVDFLNRFRPGEFHILVAIDPDDGKIAARTCKPDDEDGLRLWLTRMMEREQGIYFHVNRTLRMLDKKAERTDIQTVDWLHVDVDPDVGFDLRSEQNRILGLLQKHEGLPEPTIIVQSGGGLQAFWKLKEPILIDCNLAKAEVAKLYNLQIEKLLGGDSCHNVDRIMRVPGTINFPNKKKRKRGQEPVRATVMDWNENVYDISEFSKAPMVQDGISGGSSDGTPEVYISGNIPRLQDVEQLGPPVSQRVKAIIVTGTDEEQPLQGRDQSRSAWLLHVCCELVRAEVEDEVIYSVITDPDFAISESVIKGKGPTQIERYATRQIRRAKELNIDPLLEQLNAKYIFVEDMGGRARIAKESWNPSLGYTDISYLLRDDFVATWSNRYVEISTASKKPGGSPVISYQPAGTWWIQNPNRRSAERVIFAPNEEFPNCLNLWRGFACDSKPGDCSLYLDHLREVLCRGNATNYNYLVRWMAFAVQFPGKVPEVAVVMRGAQGTGKGTFVKHFGSLFGCHYKHITNPDHVIGKFNSMLEDAVLVFADECFIPGSKGHESNLKTLISEDTLNLEKKGVDVSAGRNCSHVVMASNDGWVVPVAHDDRRFFILDVADAKRCDGAYFTAISDEMDGGGREALLHHLMGLDLSKFNVRARPKTREHARQKLESMGPALNWWLQKLEDGKLVPTDGEWRGEAVNDQLIEGFAECVPRMTARAAALKAASFLKEVCPKGWPKRFQMNSGVVYVDSAGRNQTRNRPVARKFPGLDELREFWDQKFGRHEWDEILPPMDKAVEDDNDGPF